MQDWILGCDVCQDVCPWNRKSPTTDEPAFQPLPDQDPIDLRELFSLSDEQFRTRFRKTPLWRPKRRGILRNAAIALGNYPHPENIQPLARGLADTEPLIRGASAWALGRHDTEPALALLESRSLTESEPDIQFEISEAISQWRSPR